MNSQNINNITLQIKPTNTMITYHTILPKVFSLSKKALLFKEGAFIVLSAPLAGGIKSIFDILLKDIPLRDIVVPVVVYGMAIFLYIITTTFDFYTGMQASKKEHIKDTGSKKGYVNSSKLWSSIWKMTGIVIISNTIIGFTYIFLILRIYWLYNGFILGLIGFFLIVILFDLHSIGENQNRRFGKKPPIYNFLDNISSAIQTRIINKILGK